MKRQSKPQPPLQIHGAQIQGRRKRQEDAFTIERLGPREVLAAAADGLGGHPAGDVASNEGAREFVRHFMECRQKRAPSPQHWLEESVHAAQRHLLKEQRSHSDRLGMATTLVGLYIKGRSMWAVSVGDSYLLRLRNGELVRLNELHGSPEGGVTSAIGFNLTQIDLQGVHRVEPGDRYLLATDGLITLDATEVEQLLGYGATPEETVREMLDAIDRHAHRYQDNATAIAVFV